MTQNIVSSGKLFSLLFVVASIFSCSSPINTVGDPHFDENGYLVLSDSTNESVLFKPVNPSRVKFYVEVSGSMNGFFRANYPTHFKTDLWAVLGYYSALAPTVNILTNEGDTGSEMTLSQFQQSMNTGAFVSSASTKIPLMLQSIFSQLQADSGEVAVLVSDMKYSPVGSAAPNVLLEQYSTDISNVFSGFGKAVSLVCATSQWLDKSGRDIAEQSSPYYYLIVGNAREVAHTRNAISILLTNQRHFVDNIDSGFDFGRPSPSFGVPTKCFRLDEKQPTFIGYEDESDMPGDTCTIKLRLNLENYRWLMSEEVVLRQALQVKAKYGSNVTIGAISIDTENITNQKLERKSIATVDLKVCNMPQESEVLEWTLELPSTDYTLFNEFFEGANKENDAKKSFSVLNFIRGIFYGGVINQRLEPNYILISRNS